MQQYLPSGVFFNHFGWVVCIETGHGCHPGTPVPMLGQHIELNLFNILRQKRKHDLDTENFVKIPRKKKYVNSQISDGWMDGWMDGRTDSHSFMKKAIVNKAHLSS